MIQLKPNESQKAYAKEQSEGFKEGSRTVMGNGRNFIGFVGEKAVADLLKAQHLPANHYDLILEDGTKVECKTFSNKYEPKPHFECNVMETSTFQQCDIYIFSSYNIEKNLLYVCGYISRDDFYAKAKKIRKGEVSPKNGIKYRANGYIITVRDLLPIEDLL
jgi:hypothetical protein